MDKKEDASILRKKLLKNGVGTKILPEAITWHFAGMWDHIPSLIKAHNYSIKEDLKSSEEILTKSVSLPITVNQDPLLPTKIRDAILDN